MKNDDIMTEREGGGRSKMTKLLMLIFQSSFIKPSLEICLVTTKEGTVTKGFQQWSGAQHTLFCRKISFVASHAHMGGGVAKK